MESTIVPGDVLLGLPSAGLHTNGYSLARHVMFERCGLRADSPVPELGATAGDALLAPHRSYLAAVRPLLDEGLVKGMAHITGGGLTENVPRVLPAGCGVEIDRRAWQPPAIFPFLQDRGGIADAEMYRAFNMGVGLVIVCSAAGAARAATLLGPDAIRSLGRVVPGDRVVRYTDAS